LRACLIARDASFNMKELITESSNLAFLAIKDCERELDQIERQIDGRIPEAITQVNEAQARELLACLKFITDLERIGDLLWWVAQRWPRSSQLSKEDRKLFGEMATSVQTMLQQVYEAFIHRDIELAMAVISSDSKLDQLRRSLFQKHLENPKRTRLKINSVIEILLMVQAFERAGDHAKDLAEEVYNLVEGRSLRHAPERRRMSEIAAR
jgi:phosphate transport system protein